MPIAQSNPFAVRVEPLPSDTLLARVTAALAPGDWVEIPEGVNNDQVTTLDIQWQSAAAYYDRIRRELQYMGKPASGQSTVYTHYIYSETTSSWRATA